MAEHDIMVVPECDTAPLEQALYAQQHLLQQLYTELDAEREASASAASEALSMILRLQGEKASLKMEASQYKRMAEEKMDHAEEALAIFEDLIYQRELEIASLEFQVQAYRYRLLSMGCNDLGVYENKFPEKLLVQRNDSLSGEKSVCSTVRRLNSLPTNLKKKRPTIPLPDSTPIIVDENASQEVNDSERKFGTSVSGDIDSYWEQIKRLDERVKEISISKDSGRNKLALCKVGTWSPSLFSHMSIKPPVDSAKGRKTTNLDQIEQNDISPEREATSSSTCSSNIQDIFEVTVPKARDPQKECHSVPPGCEDKIGKPDFLSEDVLEPPRNKDERDRVKTMLVCSSQEKRTPKPRDGTTSDRIVAHVRPIVGEDNPQAEYQQLIRRIEQLERARNNVGAEIIAEGEEELDLLKEIREQLRSIQSEMRHWRAKKSLLPDKASLDPLQEAMIYFWL